MAVTLSNLRFNVLGNERMGIVDVTGPASYTTGGESLTAAQINQLMPEFAGKLAATDADKVEFFMSDRNASDQYLILDQPNDKIMYFTNAGQVAGATNLSAVTIQARYFYKA